MGCFGKVQRNLSGQAPSHGLKTKVFNQCVLPAMTYGCYTLYPTKALVKKLETSQRAMSRKCKMTVSVTPLLGKEPE